MVDVPSVADPRMVRRLRIPRESTLLTHPDRPSTSRGRSTWVGVALRAAAMLGLVASLGNGAPERPPQPSVHSVENWRQPQGLPQNTVLTVLQTRDSYLWVG